MNKKMDKHTNATQFRALVCFMEKNPKVPLFSKGFDDNIAEWEKLVAELNSLGPPIRDLNGWKKVWSDYKVNIKKKLTHNKEQLKSTGGGPNKSLYISPIEESVANLTGLYKAVEGLKNTKSFGVPETTCTEKDPQSSRERDPQISSVIELNEDLLFDIETQDKEHADITFVNSNEIITSFQKESNTTHRESRKRSAEPQTKRSSKKSNIAILENHIKKYENFMTGIAKSLEDLKECNKETATYLRKNYKALERIGDLTKQKLKEQKRHNDKKERQQDEKILIKRRLLEIEELKLKSLEESIQNNNIL